MTSGGARPPAGLVLAAGRSTRAGAVDKLTVEVEGEPMVRRVARIALDAGLDPVVVVTSGRGGGVRGALEGLGVRRVTNPRAHEGMGTSVAVGVEALPAEVPAVVVLLGDMPWLLPQTVVALGRAFRASDGRAPCVPVRDGRRGNPVLWPGAYFGSLTSLTGDVGARSLLVDDGYLQVPVDDPGIHRDVDTRADLEALDSPTGADDPCRS